MNFTFDKIMLRSKVLDPVTATLGAAALGLGGSIIGANAAEKGAEEAADATKESTAAQISAQEAAAAQARQDFAPFLNLAPESLAMLQSSIYSRPQTYVDTQGVTQTAQGQQFDLANFNPEDTAAYQWQKDQTLQDLGNYFNLVGRGKGSTVQSNTTAKALGDLNASEYEKGYNRLFTQKQDYINNLLNMVKTAQGAAGSTSTLGQSSANNISNAYGQQGQTLAGLEQSTGLTNANLYAGVVPSTMATIGTGLKLADYYNQPTASLSEVPTTDSMNFNWNF